jgi:zinc-binding in reverse transcriptase
MENQSTSQDKGVAWLMTPNRILTTDNLIRRGWSLVNICFMCRVDCESVDHLFNTCPISRSLYNLLTQQCIWHINEGGTEQNLIAATYDKKLHKIAAAY